MLYASLQPLRHIQFEAQGVPWEVPVKQDPANSPVCQNIAIQVDPRWRGMGARLIEEAIRNVGDAVFSQ
ncbi:hypothetical protein D3C79_1079970 [compost metagenome]